MLIKILQRLRKPNSDALSRCNLDPEKPEEVCELLTKAGYATLGREYKNASRALVEHSRALITMATLHDTLAEHRPTPALGKLVEHKRLAWARIEEAQLESRLKRP